MKCLKEAFGSYVEADPTCQRCKEYFPLVFQLCQGVVKLTQQSKAENATIPDISSLSGQPIQTQQTNSIKEEVKMEAEVVQIQKEQKERGRKGDALMKRFKSMFREIASKTQSRDEAMTQLYEATSNFTTEELRTLLVKVSMWMFWNIYKAKQS